MSTAYQQDLEEERRRLRAAMRTHRAELIASLQAVREPVRSMRRIGTGLRGAAPLLPYAVAAVGVAFVALQLRRGRLRPFALAALALDAWQVWSLFRRQPAARRPPAVMRKERYP